MGASFSFALYFVMTQYLFRQEGFVNGLIWPRLGSALAVAVLLFHPGIRSKVIHSLRPLSVKMRSTWLANQVLGAVGFVGQQYVISIPGVSVALISALQSMQYVFILLFATAVSLFRPRLLREHITFSIIVQKILALLCISVGLYFVSI
jgi:drug/metabolite transporter (DMT)-like permease